MAVNFNENLITEYLHDGPRYKFNTCPIPDCEKCKQLFEGEKEEYKKLHEQERLTIYEFVTRNYPVNKEDIIFKFLITVLHALRDLHKKHQSITLTRLTDTARNIANDFGKKQWDDDELNFFSQRVIGYPNRLDFRWRYVHFLMFLFHKEYVSFDEYRKNSLFGRFIPTEYFYEQVNESINQELEEILSKHMGETLTVQSNKNPFYNQLCYFEFHWAKKSFTGPNKVQGKIKHISAIVAKDYILITKEGPQGEIPITLYDYWEQKHARLFTPEQLKKMKYDRVVTIEFGREKYKEIWNWANPIVYPSSLVTFKKDGREISFDEKARELLQEIFGPVGFDESIHREAITKLRDNVEKKESEIVNLILKEKS